MATVGTPTLHTVGGSMNRIMFGPSHDHPRCSIGGERKNPCGDETGAEAQEKTPPISAIGSRSRDLARYRACEVYTGAGRWEQRQRTQMPCYEA